jgi:hypothetical protein
VHDAENKVSGLHGAVAQLNAQIPTYDKVVAIAKELRVAKQEVTAISAKAVDWSAVVGQLGRNIPSGLGVTSFSGTSGTTASTATTASAAAAAATTASSAPSGAIGSLNLGVSGNFPSSAHFDPVAQWIDDLTAVSMFSPPSVTSVANAPSSGGNTSVSFESSLWLTADANLTKNAGS